MGRHAAELTGVRKKHFQILHFHGRDRRGIRLWLCVCDCGKEFTERANRLTNDSRESCGCVMKAARSAQLVTHGMTGTPEFKSWEAARRRCNNPNDKDYHRYGGRCIQFSGAWAKFADFYRDMGPRPGAGYTLDRIDTNGNYEPGNCRWATQTTQQNNRRNNVKLKVNGEVVSLFVYFGRRRSREWQRAAYRISSGWPLADAIFQPAYAPKPKIAQQAVFL